MSKRLFVLSHQAARANALRYIAEAPAGYVITVKPPTRSLDQNALLHGLLTEIAAKALHAGQRWDVEDWKRLLTAAWLRARKESAIFVPALDGQGFDILYRRTSKLSKAECSELVDYIQAWAAGQGIGVEHEAA